MSAKHFRITSNLLFNTSPSLLMTPSPVQKGSGPGHNRKLHSSIGARLPRNFKQPHSPSVDTEKSPVERTQPTRVIETRTPSSNRNTRALTNSSVGSLMTPRKDYMHVNERTEGNEETQTFGVNPFGIEQEVLESPYYKQKLYENERMRVEISRLESELRNCKRTLKTQSTQDEMYAANQLNENDLKEILETLASMLTKSEEAYENIEKRCTRLNELIIYIESGVFTSYKSLELKAFTDTLKHITQEFKTSAELEVDAGKISRELVKKKLDIAHLNSRYQKMSFRCETLQADLDVLRESLKAGYVEKNLFIKNLTKEKTLNRETQRKLGDLQKTLEMLTDIPQPKPSQGENDASIFNSPVKESQPRPTENPAQKVEENIYSTTKLREALTKLVKENEALRRVIQIKDKEIEKLNDSLAKTLWKLNKATLRIEKLRNHQTGTKMNDGTQDEEDLLVFYTNKQALQASKPGGEIGFLDTYRDARGLPRNLDFRFGVFEERYVDLVNDVLEGGSQAFAEHIRMLRSDEEIKEGVTLIANQFISYRNFSEKMNRLMEQCFELYSLKSFNEIMVYVSTNMKQILGANTVRIWIHEPMMGTFRTMESAEKELKCLVKTGLIAEVIRTSSRVLKRSKEEKYTIMEYLHNDGTTTVERAHNCLLVPLKNEKEQIVGILEVTKFNYDAFLSDLDYFAHVLAELCKILWEKASRERVINQDLKHKEMYFDAFADLSNCISEKEFTDKVEQWVVDIFQSSNVQYILADNSQLVKFAKNGSPKLLDSNGIIGIVANNKKPFILLDVQGNTTHSQNVDINTTFPLYTTPIMLKKRFRDANEDKKDMLVGILQMVLTQKSVVREGTTEECLLDHVKILDPNLENLIAKFTKLVAVAYDTMKQKIECGHLLLQSKKDAKNHKA